MDASEIDRCDDKKTEEFLDVTLLRSGWKKNRCEAMFLSTTE